MVQALRAGEHFRRMMGSDDMTDAVQLVSLCLHSMDAPVAQIVLLELLGRRDDESDKENIRTLWKILLSRKEF